MRKLVFFLFFLRQSILCTNSSVKLLIFEGEGFLVREAALPPPHKMDENKWKNREHIEEILFLLNKSQWPRLVQYLIGCLH